MAGCGSASVWAADRRNVPIVDGHAVLISQIQAGGVGLNLQAASVVTICEPQAKPTTEEQAISRLHRMGQVRSVQAHRLLVSDSVDERMLEILAEKAKLFDDYARRAGSGSANEHLRRETGLQALLAGRGLTFCGKRAGHLG